MTTNSLPPLTAASRDRRQSTHARSCGQAHCLGDRFFAAAGPRFWNSLPVHLRQPDPSLAQFRRAIIKTRLFVAA